MCSGSAQFRFDLFYNKVCYACYPISLSLNTSNSTFSKFYKEKRILQTFQEINLKPPLIVKDYDMISPPPPQSPLVQRQFSTSNPNLHHKKKTELSFQFHLYFEAVIVIFIFAVIFVFSSLSFKEQNYVQTASEKFVNSLNQPVFSDKCNGLDLTKIDQSLKWDLCRPSSEGANCVKPSKKDAPTEAEFLLFNKKFSGYIQNKMAIRVPYWFQWNDESCPIETAIDTCVASAFDICKNTFNTTSTNSIMDNADDHLWHTPFFITASILGIIVAYVIQALFVEEDFGARKFSVR